MFREFVICLLFSFATSAPIEPIENDSPIARIISYENKSDGEGNYEFSFETSNGILRRESGVLMHKGEPEEYIAVEGEYTYTDPDGVVHIIRYQADKNGFEILPERIPQVIQSLPSQVVATMLG